jgi:lysozyme
MQTDAAGHAFIESNEDPAGPMLTVQPDTGGKFQIGYGHQCAQDAYPDGIDDQDAEDLMADDVAVCDGAIAELGWTLNQNQWNALSDFTYECGPEALQELAAHGQDQVTTQLPRWVHAKVNGVETVLPGMVKRRAAEVALFLS